MDDTMRVKNKSLDILVDSNNNNKEPLSIHLNNLHIRASTVHAV
jgi:hypothetical protein